MWGTRAEGWPQSPPLRHPWSSRRFPSSVQLHNSIVKGTFFFFLNNNNNKNNKTLTFLPLCFKFQFLSLHSLLYTKLLKSPTALQSKIFQKAVIPNMDWRKWNQTEGKIFWTFPCLVHCVRIWQQVIKIDYLAFPHKTNAKFSVSPITA